VLGDYPQYLPGAGKHRTGWMLLSYKKKARVSSALAKFPAENAFDENIKTYWSAETGGQGEWLEVDLGKRCRIRAIQVNFAEHDVKVGGRVPDFYHQYVIEASRDGAKWSTLVDKSANKTDVPHDYVELAKPAMARYVKLRNVRFPGGGKFSVRDLRIFGSALGAPPARVTEFAVERSPNDPRNAQVSWKPVQGASGYIVRYGIAPDKLYNNYQVQEGTSVKINSLNKGVDYFFTVDAFNGSGVTEGPRSGRGR
jgi:xylan 1,4-beta-xylosidase